MTSPDNFFFEKVSFFPVIENGKIPTDELLEAAKSIVEFLELLGIAFKPVRDDIDGNITKLRNAYKKDTVRFVTLNDILEEENQRITDGSFKMATDALLWLTRALFYNQLFLLEFYNDMKRCNNLEDLSLLPETLTQHFEKSYELSLKKHHNWFVQKIFSVCLRAVPFRTSLLQTLGYVPKGKKIDLTARDNILATLEPYLETLRDCNQSLILLLKKYNLTV